MPTCQPHWIRGQNIISKPAHHEYSQGNKKKGEPAKKEENTGKNAGNRNAGEGSVLRFKAHLKYLDQMDDKDSKLIACSIGASQESSRDRYVR